MKRKSQSNQIHETTEWNKEKKQKQEREIQQSWFFPTELWIHITRYLSSLDLVRLRSTCAQLRQLILDEFPTLPQKREQVLEWLTQHSEDVDSWSNWNQVCAWNSFELYKKRAWSTSRKQGQTGVFYWLYFEFVKPDLDSFEEKQVGFAIQNEWESAMRQALLYGHLDICVRLQRWGKRSHSFNEHKLWRAGIRSNRRRVWDWLRIYCHESSLSSRLHIAASVGSVRALHWMCQQCVYAPEEYLCAMVDSLLEASMRDSHSVILEWLVQFPKVYDHIAQHDVLVNILFAVSATGHSICTFKFLQERFSLSQEIVQKSNASQRCVIHCDVAGISWIHTTYPSLVQLDALLSVGMSPQQDCLSMLEWIREYMSADEWKEYGYVFLCSAIYNENQTVIDWFLKQTHVISSWPAHTLLQKAAEEGNIKLCIWIKQHLSVVIPDLQEWKRSIVAIKTIYHQTGAYEWLCSEYGFSPHHLLHEMNKTIHWSESIRSSLYACGWYGNHDIEDEDDY